MVNLIDGLHFDDDISTKFHNYDRTEKPTSLVRRKSLLTAQAPDKRCFTDTAIISGDWQWWRHGDDLPTVPSGVWPALLAVWGCYLARWAACGRGKKQEVDLTLITTLIRWTLQWILYISLPPTSMSYLSFYIFVEWTEEDGIGQEPTLPRCTVIVKRVSCLATSIFCTT